MQEPNEGKRNEMLSVREAVSEYVHNRRWDTLVGKSYHMGDEQSREEFIDFLTYHMNQIRTTGSV